MAAPTTNCMSGRWSARVLSMLRYLPAAQPAWYRGVCALKCSLEACTGGCVYLSAALPYQMHACTTLPAASLQQLPVRHADEVDPKP